MLQSYRRPEYNACVHTHIGQTDSWLAALAKSKVALGPSFSIPGFFTAPHEFHYTGGVCATREHTRSHSMTNSDQNNSSISCMQQAPQDSPFHGKRNKQALRSIGNHSRKGLLCALKVRAAPVFALWHNVPLAQAPITHIIESGPANCRAQFCHLKDAKQRWVFFFHTLIFSTTFFPPGFKTSTETPWLLKRDTATGNTSDDFYQCL